MDVIYMKELVTAFKFYNFSPRISTRHREKFLKVFQKILEERIPEVPITFDLIKILPDNRVSIQFHGNRTDDEVLVYNIWSELVGSTIEFKALKVGDIRRGYCQKVGEIGFGLFVDVGIEAPQKEVLIPLFTLREQLTGGETISNREILTKYGFLDNFPVLIEITSIISRQDSAPRIEARFAPAFLAQINAWINAEKDIVFSTGTPRQMIKRTVAKRGHTQDVVEIQRLGPLETAMICRSGTFAPGLMSSIGPFLSKTRLSMLIPAQVRRFWK